MCNLCCRYCSPCLYYVWLPRRTLHQCCNCFSLRIGTAIFALTFIVFDILFLAGAIRIALVVPQDRLKEPDDPARKPLYFGLVKPLYHGAYIFYYFIAALFFLWTFLDILLLVAAISRSLVLLSAWVLLSLERFIHVILDIVAIIFIASFSAVLQDGQQDYRETLLLITYHIASLLLLILLTYPRCVVNSFAYSLNPCEGEYPQYQSGDKCNDQPISAVCSEDQNKGAWDDSCPEGPSQRRRTCGGDYIFSVQPPYSCSCNPCDGSCIDDCGAPSQPQCNRGHIVKQDNCGQGSTRTCGQRRTCGEGSTCTKGYICSRINDPPFNIRSPTSSCVGIRQPTCNPPTSECRRDRYQTYEAYPSCPQPDYEIHPGNSRPFPSCSQPDYEYRQYPPYPEPDYDDYRLACPPYSPPDYNDRHCSYPPYLQEDYEDSRRSYPPYSRPGYEDCSSSYSPGPGYASYPRRNYEDSRWHY